MKVKDQCRYQNRRGDYVAAWFNVIDWDFATERFNKGRMAAEFLLGATPIRSGSLATGADTGEWAGVPEGETAVRAAARAGSAVM